MFYRVRAGIQSHDSTRIATMSCIYYANTLFSDCKLMMNGKADLIEWRWLCHDQRPGHLKRKKNHARHWAAAAATASVAHFLKKPFCCSVIIACCFVLPMYVVVEYRHVYKIMNLSGRPGESNRGHDCDFVCPSWHGSVIQKQRRLYMQPGSRCCMSSRFRWRRKKRKKKDLKGHDIQWYFRILVRTVCYN